MKKLIWLAFLSAPTVFAAPGAPSAPLPSGPSKLSDRLSDVKGKIVELEQNLIGGLRNQREAKENMKRIQTLIGLQKKERELGGARIGEIETTIQALEGRRSLIRERVDVEQRVIRKSLRDLQGISNVAWAAPADAEREVIDQPHSRLLANLVQASLREIETLKIDLEDAEALGGRISEERGQLEAMLHEMAEGEQILELNKQLQVELISRTHDDRVKQLEKYQKLKSAEGQVSELIQSFNARIELQDVQRQERAAQRSLYTLSKSPFALLKGKLGLPVLGDIVGKFGRALDRATNLTVFKKGIDIQALKSSPVRSVFQGKVAFAGQLAGYGRMIILDHGDHFYTLCGNLGTALRQVGDAVKAGEEIGTSDDSGSPVYFEIRAHNIPVNPLQWVSR